jgi:acetylglutamate kinase
VRRPIIVKIGGSALAGGALDDLPEILASETPVVLVHGGGQQLTRMLDALDIPTQFREGLRVTDEATMKVAEMVFAGEVNKALVRELYAMGIPAVGLSGTDGPTLHVQPVPNLGRVGNVTEVEPHLVETLWTGSWTARRRYPRSPRRSVRGTSREGSRSGGWCRSSGRRRRRPEKGSR